MPSSESKDNAVTSTVIDPRTADALYKPFAPFSNWANCSVDRVRVDRYSTELNRLKAESEDTLKRALEIVKRAAAVDTGAIEGLYDTDRGGFTYTVAVQAAHWEAALAKKGPKVGALFESQLKAYDFVLDFATQEMPIAEAWIRELHKVVCESQDTYEVHTAVGTQYQSLPKGKYKDNANHVRARDGSIHPWAPVDLTPREMHRFCDELRSNAFNEAHPIMQSAYAHNAFVSVHPFADGNGRVARALASVFTYRAESIPLLILKGDAEYLPALEAADHGDIQRFVDFIFEKAIDTIRLTEQSFKAAKAPSLEAALNELTGLYILGKGDSPNLVDEAGDKLFNAFKDQINERFDLVDLPNVVSLGSLSFGMIEEVLEKDYHVVGKYSSGFVISSAEPFEADVHRYFQVEAPNDATGEDFVLIRCLDSPDIFEATLSELTPEPTVAVRLRLSVWSDKLIAEALNELSTRAAALLDN
jgi:Fic family protein